MFMSTFASMLMSMSAFTFMFTSMSVSTLQPLHVFMFMFSRLCLGSCLFICVSMRMCMSTSEGCVCLCVMYDVYVVVRFCYVYF